MYTMVRLMCDNVPDLIWAKDLEKRFIFANRAVCTKLLNANDVDEPIGKTDMFFAERERQSRPDNPLWHTFGEICTDSDAVVMETRRPQRFDEFGNVQGEFLFLDVYKAPFLDDKGNMIGTVGCGRDITKEKRIEEEQKKTELLLQKSEEKYRNIFENAMDGICQVTPGGRFISANPAAARLLGYESPEELISLITDVSAQLYLYPEDRNKAISLLKRDGVLKNFEVQWRKKDGSIGWVLLNFRLVRDEEGNILYHEGTGQDITARKQTEEALVKSETRYRQLHENIRDGFLAVTMDGRIVETNSVYREMVGYTDKELRALACREITPEKWHVPVSNIIADQVMRRGYSEIYEKEYIRKDGTIFPVELRTYLIRDEKGNPAARWTIVRDITSRKETEEKLKRYQEHLEGLVKERTTELENSKEELEINNKNLEELNTALKVLLQQRVKDKKDLEDRFATNVKRLVLPYVEKVKNSHLDAQQRSFLGIIDKNLNEIVSPFLHSIGQYNFTPKEIQVAALIKDGKATKEIAEIMGVALSAIDSHRNNIRIKLGLNNQRVNLQSYLQSLI
ncbi:MAG: hypothetical protein C0392_12860 [Syntrophus sp. (in: bacteria)]|nr:hypothetical protein [Syntrophus sp. (in: bacteria)]